MNDVTHTPETLDINGTAQLLNVSHHTVYDLAARGKLPGAKIGVAWVFIKDDVMAYLRNQVQAQTQARKQKTEHKSLPESRFSTLKPPAKKQKRIYPELPALPDQGTTS